MSDRNNSEKSSLPPWVVPDPILATTNPAKFEELCANLVHVSMTSLLRYVGRLLRDREEALDVVQDAYTKVYLYSGTCDERDDAEGWVKKVAWNCALDHLKKSRRRPPRLQTVDDEHAGLDIVDPGPTPLRALEVADRNRLVAEALSLTNPLLVEVFIFRCGGLSYDEIADVLQIPVETARTRLHRCCHRIRNYCNARDRSGTAAGGTGPAREGR